MDPFSNSKKANFEPPKNSLRRLKTLGPPIQALEDN
jgi:hypothetical protein